MEITVKDETDYFNPRPREEGDCRYEHRRLQCRYISIHALVKRATLIGGTNNG